MTIKKIEARNVRRGDLVFIPAQGKWLEVLETEQSGTKDFRSFRFGEIADYWIMFHRLFQVEVKRP